MYFLQIVFAFVLLLSITYAAIFGGRTGKAGALIFFLSSVLTMVAAMAAPAWDETAIGVFLVDLGCLAALITLALSSNRYWPIWASGFQIVAVSTHLATIWAPEFVPRAYQGIAAFWSIPILAVMVAGTRLDWLHDAGRKSRLP